MTEARYTSEWPPAEGAVYRVLDTDGKLLAPLPPGLELARVQELYRWMRTLRLLDERMLRLQRQGRISFYGACTGQEAAVIGSGAALEPTDWVFPALREGGVLLLRGHDLRAYIAQLYGNSGDPTHGRQMPCHFSSRERRFVSLSSPIGNQLPQAVGAAMAIRARKTQEIAVGYMGDGATSQGDFHVALHWAKQLELPVVFFCQNNQWAISVPASAQTASESFAHKARAYGMPALRVDGNDALACYRGMAWAAAHARSGAGPAFVEALTYRIGAHSTSDDPSRYRDERITEAWKLRCPLVRLQNALSDLGAFDEGAAEALDSELEARIRATVTEVEALPPPALSTLFSDVYATLPPHLAEQRAALASALGQAIGGST
jgi:pyruvate dehydrogenase E1 component alpha subunit/2-oxoisovalerate dehydrogenase E1 component alpha subunit